MKFPPSQNLATPSRRHVLQAGALLFGGLNCVDWFRIRQVQAAQNSSEPKAKACILIWLDGGPSHLDMFDLKPNAPQEVRGPFRPIETSAPGVQISETMPFTARWMHHAALLRSVTSPLGEHNLGAHYVLTGYKPNPALLYPSYGSVLAHHQPASTTGLPPYIAIPDYNSMAGEGYLPAQCRPFALGGDPAQPNFKVRDLNLYPGIDQLRLSRRKQFLADLDQFRAAADASPPSADPALEQAYQLITSPASRKAFELSAESADVRQRYGSRTIGQSCLLARRLVEAGVPFVTVTDRGWDTHDNLYNRLKEGYTGGSVGKVPVLDQALSSLLQDLHERRLLSQTLVLVMGEFGRTPKLNTSAGRDHWPRVFSVFLAGGGLQGGQALGRSDAHGESPADRPILPEDLALTIYHLLGISPTHEFHTSDGRPVPVNQGGSLIQELLA